MKPMVFERDGKTYIVGPVAPITPGKDELAGFEYANELAKVAPNENILWLRGQYVEGDRANRNGQYWTSGEIALKSLTPKFMPVTVMHDFKQVVGLIADTRLLTPDADKVEVARIDTALAIWAHRFPGIAEEIAQNYEHGTLMQSMECSSTHYDCIECGQAFVKLPNHAERANWCDHLTAGAENGTPVRRLRDVTFTGTGLIFGTRNGATGAMDRAHLEVFQSEVAEFHERAVQPRRPPRRTSVEITQAEYEALVAKSTRVEQLTAENASLKVEADKVPALTRDLEASEIAKTAVERERDTEKAAREALEESARTANLSGERLGTLGTEFIAALGEKVKATLTAQAGTMADADWTARLEELAELTKVDPKAGPAAPAPGSTTTTEIASTQFGAGGTVPVGGTPNRHQVSGVLGGLLKQTRSPRSAPPAAPAKA